MQNIFITAIGTDSGKTLVSAILCEALGAAYWKPIQAGLPRDTDMVKSLVSNTNFKSYPERYLLKTPASPHAAAKIDRVSISLSDFTVPSSQSLIVEGAGGCLVPINDTDFVIDIASQLNCDVVLVANLYLGSINHTLLTNHLLVSRKIKVKGIIFNGPSNPESERIIIHHTGLPCILRVQQEQQINKEIVMSYARQLPKDWL